MLDTYGKRMTEEQRTGASGATLDAPDELRGGVSEPRPSEPEIVGAVAIEVVGSRDGDAVPAPGTLAAHYAPRARLRLMSTADLRAALPLLGEGAKRPM